LIENEVYSSDQISEIREEIKKEINNAVKESFDQKEFIVVEDFMKMIDSNETFNKDFKDIKFGYLDKEFSNKQELLSFRIEARLK